MKQLLKQLMHLKLFLLFSLSIFFQFFYTLDADGKRLHESDYVYDETLSNGYVIIHNEKGYGLLSPQSEVVYAPRWSRIYEFRTSLGKVYVQIVRQDGEESWKRGLGDFKGNIIMPVIYKSIHSAPRRDLCVVEESENAKALYSLSRRKQITPCEFEKFCYLSEYIIAKRTGLRTLIHDNIAYIFFDYNGREVVAFASEEKVKVWLSSQNAHVPSQFDYYR